MTTPDRRTLELADRLQRLAEHVTAAKEHIAREYNASDGYATSQPCASPDDTPTKAEYDRYGNILPNPKLTGPERVGHQRQQLASRAADINDALDSIEQSVTGIGKASTGAIVIRIGTDRCSANPDLTGYKITLAAGGWHDPLCRNIPRSAAGGLCDACRNRLARYRERNGLKPATDDRVVDIDSHVALVDGVAIIRPNERTAT